MKRSLFRNLLLASAFAAVSCDEDKSKEAAPARTVVVEKEVEKQSAMQFQPTSRDQYGQMHAYVYTVEEPEFGGGNNYIIYDSFNETLFILNNHYVNFHGTSFTTEYVGPVPEKGEDEVLVSSIYALKGSLKSPNASMNEVKERHVTLFPTNKGGQNRRTNFGYDPISEDIRKQAYPFIQALEAFRHTSNLHPAPGR